MYYVSLESGFWFCEVVHFGPCEMLYHSIFDKEYRFRMIALAAACSFLLATELCYRGVAMAFPSIARLRYPNYDPNQVDTEDTWPSMSECCENNRLGKRTMANLRKRMAATKAFEYISFKRAQSDVKSYPACPICLTDFDPNETIIRSIQCHHIFHEDCLAVWMCRQKSCPYCRTKLLSKPSEKEQALSPSERPPRG